MLRRRIEYKIDSNIRTPNRGLGISLPFNTQNVFTLNYTTKAQTKSNLTNYMLTNKGERVFNPEFGADLRRLLFDPNSDFTSARDLLAEQLGIYFPNITVNNLQFSADTQRNLLNIKLDYSINNTEDSILIQIT
jgi:phage baseplate assembly protein W